MIVVMILILVLENDLQNHWLSDTEHQGETGRALYLITRNAGAGENSLVYQTLYQETSWAD